MKVEGVQMGLLISVSSAAHTPSLRAVLTICTTMPIPEICEHQHNGAVTR